MMLATTKLHGDLRDKFFWSFGAANQPRQDNRWLEWETGGGYLEVWAGWLHLVCPWPLS